MTALRAWAAYLGNRVLELLANEPPGHWRPHESSRNQRSKSWN